MGSRTDAAVAVWDRVRADYRTSVVQELARRRMEEEDHALGAWSARADLLVRRGAVGASVVALLLAMLVVFAAFGTPTIGPLWTVSLLFPAMYVAVQGALDPAHRRLEPLLTSYLGVLSLYAGAWLLISLLVLFISSFLELLGVPPGPFAATLEGAGRVVIAATTAAPIGVAAFRLGRVLGGRAAELARKRRREAHHQQVHHGLTQAPLAPLPLGSYDEADYALLSRFVSERLAACTRECRAEISATAAETRAALVDLNARIDTAVRLAIDPQAERDLLDEAAASVRETWWEQINQAERMLQAVAEVEAAIRERFRVIESLKATHDREIAAREASRRARAAILASGATVAAIDDRLTECGRRLHSEVGGLLRLLQDSHAALSATHEVAVLEGPPRG